MSSTDETTLEPAAVTTTEPSDLPKGPLLSPFNPAYMEAPHQVLGAARASCPVYHDEQYGRYVVLNHDDVRRSLRDKGFFVDGRKANPGTFPQEFPEFIVADEKSILALDDPDHGRLRALIAKAFTPKAVEAMRPIAAALARELLEEIDTSAEFDLIQEFARPYPTYVIAEMLGIDRKHCEDIKNWSEASVRGGFNFDASEEVLRAAQHANNSLSELFVREIANRRAKPGDDLISGMVLAQDGDDKLTDEEIVTQCNVLLVAGNVTLTDLLGSVMRRLLENPEQMTRLREEPSLVENTVEEALRFDPPVEAGARIASRDIELAGCPIRRGEFLYLSIVAANHDPAVYSNPDIFDIEREDTHHQSFGGGAHHCLGAALGRLEAQEALRAIVEHFPTLSMHPKGFEVALTPNLRGLEHLWLCAPP